MPGGGWGRDSEGKARLFLGRFGPGTIVMYRSTDVMVGGTGPVSGSKYVYVYGAARACAYCTWLNSTSSKREALTVT